MKAILRYGSYKVVEQELHHNRTKKRNGLRGSWIEYQVREGRRVLSRHELLHLAEADAKARSEADWDALAKEARALGWIA